MRRLTDAAVIHEFFRRLNREANVASRVYLTGGACAVLLGWRSTTIDIDLKLDPERDEIFRAIPRLKDELQVNVEFACPSDFVPELPAWRERSQFVERQGKLELLHYDFYSQALAKVERGHAQDRDDVKSMMDTGLVAPDRLLALFESVEPNLARYPAVDPAELRRRLEALAG